MNRQERKAIAKQANKSIAIIRSHLDYLNATGNPKYELKKVSTLKYKIKRLLRIK